MAQMGANYFYDLPEELFIHIYSFLGVNNHQEMNNSNKLVKESYKEAILSNRRKFLKGNPNASSQYIFDNQKDDASNIVRLLNTDSILAVSVQKRTKVGADGLMIEIAKNMCTTDILEQCIHYSNVRIITGMNNKDWQQEMIKKAPSCFKKSIFHHGQLKHSNLNNMKNGLIIIDEIDSGSKEDQNLHTLLKKSGLLEVENLVKNNNKFVFISATCMKEIHILQNWSELHTSYKMTIPDSYIGHGDFLNYGIIKPFYSLKSSRNVVEWIVDDIMTNYGTDFRVHFVRINTNTLSIISEKCRQFGISFKLHTSENRIPKKELANIFESPLKQHVVIGVKGLMRRANFIPNAWKLRIGCVHEYYVKDNMVDYNVQIQGLIGRMTGYWRSQIEEGHKTGPYRCSVESIYDYEDSYNDPLNVASYKTNGFKVVDGVVKKIVPNMLSLKFSETAM